MGKLEAKGAGLSLQVLSGCSQVMKGTCYLLPSLETRGSALYNADSVEGPQPSHKIKVRAIWAPYHCLRLPASGIHLEREMTPH
jgi:hypothetical protein